MAWNTNTFAPQFFSQALPSDVDIAEAYVNIDNIFWKFKFHFFSIFSPNYGYRMAKYYLISIKRPTNHQKVPKFNKKPYPHCLPPPLGLSTFWKLKIFTIRNFLSTCDDPPPPWPLSTFISLPTLIHIWGPPHP